MPIAAEPTSDPIPSSQFLTLMLSYFALGVTVSVALTERGVDPWLILTAGLIVHSATSELAHVAVTDAGGWFWAGIGGGWLVAARFGVLAATLRPRLDPSLSRWKGAAMALNVFDPNTAIALSKPDSDGANRAFWQVTLALVIGWWGGSAVGVLMGNILTNADALGLDVVFPATLIAVIGRQLRSAAGLVTAAVAAVIMLASLPHLPAGVPIVLATVVAAAGVLVAAKTNPGASP